MGNGLTGGTQGQQHLGGQAHQKSVWEAAPPAGVSPLQGESRLFLGLFVVCMGISQYAEQATVGGNKTTRGIHHPVVPQDPVPWSVFLLLFTFQSSDACLINDI